jgi:hypothetical protein
MSKDAEETRVAGTGTIYIAAYGASFPSAWDAAIPSAYADLGYTNEDGVTFTDEPTIERKGAWQSFYPIRILETARMAKAAFALVQWNRSALKAAAGGGTVEAAGTGSKFTPHEAGTVTEWSVIVEVVDGDITDRYIIPKCITTSSLETKLNRTELAELPVELEAIGIDGEDPWYLLTSDATAFPADA